MTVTANARPLVAIACGGTGGHLFPGLAVAEQLQRRGCDVVLLISPKEIDQQAVKNTTNLEVFTLPAVALQNGNYFSFSSAFVKSLISTGKIFRRRKPAAVLAMGGFTSAPPVFAAKAMGAKTFLHESNTIPGRANRLLARFVDAAFIGFPESAGRLGAKRHLLTGTPVRPQFTPACRPAFTPSECRMALGLKASLPTILVVGGSQGAHGLNELVLAALPLLKNCGWQWLHLTGANDFEKVKTTYARHGISAVVKSFLKEMEMALGAATAAVSRAGASSLAEIAAMQVVPLLVPLPTAADNHQYFNARAFEKSGAARVIEQKSSTPEDLAKLLTELVDDETKRQQIKTALAKWYAPEAATQIAQNMVMQLGEKFVPGKPQYDGAETGSMDLKIVT